MWVDSARDIQNSSCLSKYTNSRTLDTLELKRVARYITHIAVEGEPSKYCESKGSIRHEIFLHSKRINVITTEIMGASASKAARQTASGAARKYPSRTPPPTNAARPSAPAQGPTVHPEPYAAPTRNAAIDQDASDPVFAQSLRSLGPVRPTDTRPPSSRFTQVLADKSHRSSISAAPNGPPVTPDPSSNPAIQLLVHRQRWQDLADHEAGEGGRTGFVGRELMVATTLRRALTMRDNGKADSAIESALDLKAGTMARLGPPGMIGVTEVGRE